MNPLFNQLQGSPSGGIMQQFNLFRQNPFQFLMQRRRNIPQQYMNDPKGAVEYLMQNGQMSQQQFQQFSQMANQMGLKL